MPREVEAGELEETNPEFLKLCVDRRIDCEGYPSENDSVPESLVNLLTELSDRIEESGDLHESRVFAGDRVSLCSNRFFGDVFREYDRMARNALVPIDGKLMSVYFLNIEDASGMEDAVDELMARLAPPREGFVRVIWGELPEVGDYVITTVPVQILDVVERPVVLSNHVECLSSTNDRQGVVVDVKEFCDGERLTGEVIRGIPCHILRDVFDIAPYRVVLSPSTDGIGEIDTAEGFAILRFGHNVYRAIPGTVLEDFLDSQGIEADGRPYGFGFTLTNRIMKETFRLTIEHGRLRDRAATVVRVVPRSIVVTWLKGEGPDDVEFNTRDVFFPALECTAEIGVQALLPPDFDVSGVAERDRLVPNRESMDEESAYYDAPRVESLLSRSMPSREVFSEEAVALSNYCAWLNGAHSAAEINARIASESPNWGRLDITDRVIRVTRLKSYVTVRWQDGTLERNIPVDDLRVFQDEDEDGEIDYFPNEFVVYRPLNAEDGVLNKVVGVVQSYDNEEKTLSVNWLTDEEIGLSPPLQEIMKEDAERIPSVVSLFEVERHPVFSWRQDDIVYLDNPTRGTLLTTIQSFRPPDRVAECGLSYGLVMGMKGGKLIVLRNGGTIEEFYPVDVFPRAIDDDDSDEEEIEGYFDEGSDDSGWETVSDDDDGSSSEADTGDSESGGDISRESSTLDEDDVDEGGVVDRPEAMRKTPERRLSADPVAPGQATMKGKDDCQKGNVLTEMGEVKDPNGRHGSTHGDQEPTEELGVEVGALGTETAVGGVGSLDRFTLVSGEMGDHHFVNRDVQYNNPRDVMLRLRREWKILSESLSEGIFVRGLESRTELLRAMIVGPAGTPYADIPFFFDLQLRPDYPYSPPIVHYWSYGQMLHPNLYKSGYVCLSLVGTAMHSGPESWSPSSTLLQLFVSIQGLVLVDKPYFTEAGYASRRLTEEGERCALEFNEHCYLLSLRSLLLMMKDRPQHFEQILVDHLRSVGPRIIERCETVLNGDANACLPTSPSPGFLKALRAVLSSVKAALPL